MPCADEADSPRPMSGAWRIGDMPVRIDSARSARPPTMTEVAVPSTTGASRLGPGDGVGRPEHRTPCAGSARACTCRAPTPRLH